MRLLAFILISLSPSAALAQSLSPPFSTYSYVNPPISSWFGPRVLSGAFAYHAGIDYGMPQGTPIVAVEGGTITDIRYDTAGGGYYVELTGATGVWRHLHTFTNSGGNLPVASGNWTLSCSNNSQFCTTGTLSIQRPVVPVSNTLSYSTRTISALAGQNSIGAREPLAPVGNSGPAAFHLHLNFDAGAGKTNPLQFVNHVKSTPTVTVTAPPEGSVFGDTSTLVGYLVTARINGTNGKDLNYADFYVDGALQHWPGDATSHTFNFGGRTNELRLGATVYSTTGNGVEPIQGETFHPYFHRVLNLSGLGNGSHEICVEGTNVNNDYTSQSCTNFIVDSGPTDPTPNDEDGGGMGSNPTTDQKGRGEGRSISGVQRIEVLKDGVSLVVSTFPCAAVERSTVAFTPIFDLVSGSTYTFSVTNCAGTQTSTARVVAPGTGQATVCVEGTCQTTTPGSGSTVIRAEVSGSGGYPALDVYCASVNLLGRSLCCSVGGSNCTNGGQPFWEELYAGGACPGGFAIANSTNTQWPSAIRVTGKLGASGPSVEIAPPDVGTVKAGSFAIPQSGSNCPNGSDDAALASATSIWDLLWKKFIALTTAMTDAVERKLLSFMPPGGGFFGSAGYFAPGTINITVPAPAGVVVSTASLAIYRFDGVDWSSSSISAQSFSTHTVGGAYTASGTITSTGYYALFFVGTDTTAPVTTLSFQGSTSSFAGSVLVSTSALIVLTSTDTKINGFASTVATTYYRIDPASTTSSYSAYSDSITLSPGFHTFQYYSRDWAGNDEGVRTSTFLVTAGTLGRMTADVRVRGNFTRGFLSYGLQADIQASVENSYTLLLSSADGSPIWTTTDSGQSVMGGWIPDANLDLIPASPAFPAMALRSGNASTATPSAQIAFGYDGGVSMRHAIRTEHATVAAGNAIDFLLWSPVTGSTATLGNQEALSIQGISGAHGVSFHVHAATGAADAEVEVSDGQTLGNGIIHTIGSYQHSARELKTDIEPLSDRERRQGAADALALRPASFRYKSSPGAARKGLIFEDAPESVRGAGQSVVFDERLINAELALQEAMARLEALQKKLKALQEGH